MPATITIMGRLTADPQIKQTRGEEPEPYVSGSIAFDDRSGKPCFVSYIVFGKSAVNFEKIMGKGQSISVIGEMLNADYENRHTQTLVKGFSVRINTWQAGVVAMEKKERVEVPEEKEVTEDIPYAAEFTKKEPDEKNNNKKQNLVF